jgi:UPF0716 protein FxsA
VFGKLFLLFTLLPLLELLVLIQIGERIGAVPTIAMVLFSGVLGAALARAEGLRVARAFRQSVSTGQVPADSVINGALVLLGCALLITPGVLSDVLGIVLLLPPSRRIALRIVSARVRSALERGALRVVSAPGMPRDPFGTARPPIRGQVIDVHGEPVEPSREDPKRIAQRIDSDPSDR